MLTLYHTPLSINSRRVWVALLEKGLDFETVEVDLGGDQFKPEFLTLNPFHHIPVLVDGELTVIESFAILDYIDAQYPQPPLLPEKAADLATVRMVQMVTVNELLPALAPLTKKMMGFGEPDADAIAQTLDKVSGILAFFEQKLDDRPYFGRDRLTLAEVVLGTVTAWFPDIGVDLAPYPQLQRWAQGLLERDAWQRTQPTPEAIAAFKARMAQRMAQRQ
ncbi:MAG: glutathione S-transferase family protein [Leptolyngbya sp. LCM1.Bin17]|nr:MAG: glutathione S-transferase family protein [Leptolyngbya sp. LCM1.Bin17]